MSKVECLGGRVQVMEVESLLAARVSTQRTSPTGLFDEHVLDGPPTLGHGFRSTADAPVVATTLKHEWGRSVVSANHLRSLGIAQRAGTPVAEGAKLVATHPMSNRRCTPIKSVGDLP